jgi:DNA-binding MarR family transcriptional regulator
LLASLNENPNSPVLTKLVYQGKLFTMINNSENTGAAIVGRLQVTARALEKVADAILSRYGITLGMYEVLVLIAAGIDTTTRIANASQITPASITHKTKLMEAKGYIRRAMDTKDRRVWYFSLADRGQHLLETVLVVYDRVTRPLFAQLSDKERQLILTFLMGTEEHMRVALENRSLVLEHVDGLLRQEFPGGDTSLTED